MSQSKAHILRRLSKIGRKVIEYAYVSGQCRQTINVNVFAVITKYPRPSDNWIIKAFFDPSSADFFFRINLFEKLFQEYVLSGLIWVKAVCKSYQQTTLRDKELYD